jgi:hypothetical protein
MKKKEVPRIFLNFSDQNRICVEAYKKRKANCIIKGIDGKPYASDLALSCEFEKKIKQSVVKQTQNK